MAMWRMAFRMGANGEDMWPYCSALGVAAITYEPLARVDLSQHEWREPKELWDKLRSAQKSSLSAIAYEMKEGDTIYVKQGPKIVRKGAVLGSYQFDSEFRIVDENGLAWAHQVPVKWDPYFLAVKVLMGSELSTVKKMTEEDFELIKAAAHGVAY